MANNDRRYLKITYDQILSVLGSILRAKQGSLADFGNSSYGRTILELFSALTDMNANWIEGSFRDSWLESAENTPAVYVGARSIGYSVRRAVPARSSFGIALKRTGSKPSVKVIIPKNTVFTISGVNLLALDDVEFIYSRNQPNFQNGIMSITSGRNILVEGTIRKQQFFANGTKFQEFNLLDPTFSDWFGTNDPNYIEPDDMASRMSRFTVVTTDAGLVDGKVNTIPGLEDKVFWKISRRGLNDPFNSSEFLDSASFLSNTNKTNNFTALIETANDGTVKLSFGDGVMSAIPFGLIDFKYLSTNGENGNLLNIAGKEINTSSQNILITQLNGQESDLTLDDLSIALTSDLRGGLNIESIDSIKKNASQVYSTLDSLGSSNSYKLFLSRVFDIKYVNAFGEDLISKFGGKKTNIKYSNVVRYTLLKDLYRKKDNNYYVTDPYEYYVDGYKVNGALYLWGYDYSDLPSGQDINKINVSLKQLKSNIDNSDVSLIKSDDTSNNAFNDYIRGVFYEASVGVSADDYLSNSNNLDNFLVQLNKISSDEFIKSYVPLNIDSSLVPEMIFNAQLAPEDFINIGSELDTINSALNRRGYLTLENNHVYVSPIVHDMGMKIDLILFEGTTFTDIKTKVIQAVYGFLKDNTDFSTHIFRSRIESLIQNMPEVAGLNIRFTSRNNQFSGLKLDELLWLGPSAAQFIKTDNGVLDIINGINVQLIFNYNSESSSQSFTITNQDDIQNKILNYYKLYMSVKNSDGSYVPNPKSTEEDVNKFVSYIWFLTFNQVYVELNKLYLLKDGISVMVCYSLMILNLLQV